MVVAVGCNSVSRPKYAPEGYRRCKLCNGLVRKGRKCKCGRKTPEQMERQRLMDLERVRRCKTDSPDLCGRVKGGQGPCAVCGGETTTMDEDGRYLCRACAQRSGTAITVGSPKPVRKCADCGADITNRHGAARLCVACADERTRRAARERMAKKRRATGRKCVDCGAGIDFRGAGAKRCEECQKKHTRERENARRRAEAARPETITCKQCGKEYPNGKTGRNRTFCAECAAERQRGRERTSYDAAKAARRVRFDARTCADCGASIAERGNGARRCAECSRKRAAERNRERQRRKREAACGT